MTGLLITAFCCLIASILWYVFARKGHTRLAQPIGHCGVDKQPILGEKELKALLTSYIRQQQLSFGLLWFCLALGVIMAGTLIGLLVALELNAEVVGSAIALTADLLVGKGALNLYTAASNRIDTFLSSIGGLEMASAE